MSFFLSVAIVTSLPFISLSAFANKKLNLPPVPRPEGQITQPAPEKTTEIKTQFGGGSAMEMLQAKPIPVDAPQTKAKVKLTAKCTDSSGHSYSSTDKGYENCLRQNAAQKNPGQNPNPNQSVMGVEFN